MPTYDTATAKIVWNSIVSTPKSKYMCIDVNIFYLVAPLTRYEYIHISITLILDTIICQYNCFSLGINIFIYLYINKVVYAFTQYGSLENDILTKRLDPKGYFQCTHTPGLWPQNFSPYFAPWMLTNLASNK